MDPSAILCRYKNSFDNNGETPIVLHTYETKGEDVDNLVKTNLVLSGTKILDPDPKKGLYCDPILLKTTKETTNNKLTDPFGDVSPKPFVNQDSIILSNLDMVFNFSKHTSGYIIKQESVKDFSFATIDDGPGGFSQYVMYRNPSSYGYGTTPIGHPFNTNVIDLTHFNIIEGPSGKGNIYQDYKYFIKSIRTVEATGVDLVLGNYVSDEAVNALGYHIRLLIALNLVKIGGTFISKVSLNDNLMIDLLYITSLCFNKVTLFKPLSTNINDDVYYVVAENSKINNIEWSSYLEESYSESRKQNKSILKLLEAVPQDFIKWVENYNNLILMYKQYLINMEQSGITELYDTYKCKAIWNLPKLGSGER